MNVSNKTVRIAQDIATLESFGSLERNGYLFVLDGWEIRVYKVATEQLVAFSSTKADYLSSVEEFVADYGG